MKSKNNSDLNRIVDETQSNLDKITFDSKEIAIMNDSLTGRNSDLEAQIVLLNVNQNIRMNALF